jgi:N-carbamoyl-L-amino-acid hydrolase
MTASVLAIGQARPHIDGDRLLRRIDEIATIGRSAGGGIERLGFSAADREARAYLVREAAAASLLASTDAGGNILIRRPGRAGNPSLLLGSHLDTVVDAGRLDGVYGVVAALEVLQVLAEADVEAEHEPVALVLANEEGGLFPQPFWGSMVLAGRLADLPAEPLDRHGRPLRGPLAVAGGDLDALAGAAWPPGSVTGYLELHVEQGPVLERLGVPIGVVTAITGRCVLTVRVRGVAGHAGTTPMVGRRDALAAAAHLVLAVEDLATRRDLCRVATVGHLDVRPDSPNTIADDVTLSVDLRDAEPARIDAAEAEVRATLATVAAATGTTIAVVARTRSEPVATDPALRAVVHRSARELGLPAIELCSGAGHDAQIIADIAPVAMVFVPSIGGRSHVPSEDTTPADLLAGAQVLLRTALQLIRATSDDEERVHEN